MARQLALLDPSDVDWRLDEHTRDLGRQGVAEARRVLAEATWHAVAEARAQPSRLSAGRLSAGRLRLPSRSVASAGWATE